jgi:hypothetical protein
MAPDRAGDAHAVLLGTGAQGDLSLTPVGPLDAELSQALLRLATTAVVAGVQALTIDLSRVSSFGEEAVHAITCCRRLAEKTERAMSFRTGGRTAAALLLASMTASRASVHA